MSLHEIAGATKISLFYLEAIEAGRVDKLPGRFYARSFIQQYARAIDYDEEELLGLSGLADQEEQTPPALSRRDRVVAAVRAFLKEGFGVSPVKTERE